MFASTVFISLALLAQSALGEIYVTSPVASTTWQAGTQQTISWEDDGQGVPLSSFGPAKVSLATGNAIQQTSLQFISQSVDVSTTSSIVFTPDPTVGGNSNDYFIRFESLGAKDPSQPQFPALGFSAKFTMAGMTGTFNATVQSQIDGTATAPIGGAATTTSAAAGTSTPAGTSSAGSKTTTGSASTTKTSSSATHSGTASGGSSNGAAGLAVSGAITVLSPLAAVFALSL